jgi:hypothetical protein
MANTRLSEYIYRRQQGGEETDPKGEAIELMQTLAQRYGTFGPAISITRSSSSSASPSDIVSLPIIKSTTLTPCSF